MHVTILTDLSEEAINNMIDRVYVAARTCYSADTCAELYNLTDEKSIPDKVNLIKKVLASGHLSIIEHVNITFCVDGISRSASHQLVRHRLCTYSQQSQRYLCLEGKAFNYVTPPAIQNNENLRKEYQLIMEQLKNFYDRAVQAGIKAEDARFVLPNAACTNITVTTNMRNLIHILGLRCCSRAQWEIRAVFQELSKELKQYFPWMKEYLDANCKQLGYCPERSSCGAAPKLSELLEIFGKYKNSQNA